MFPVLIMLSLLIACGDGEDSKAAAAATAEAPKPAAPNPAKQLDEARKLALSGKHEDALGLAEKVLARKSDDDAVWRLIEQEAAAAGQSRGLLERLDAAKAVGGKVGPHFLLRAQLALDAQLPADALAAAKLAVEADPDGAAALMARAALAATAAGGAAPEGLSEPAKALFTWASAGDAREIAASAEAARAVKGWRAAMFRANQLIARGDNAAALTELAAAAADPDPRAKVRANLGRSRLVAGGAQGASFADAGTWASDALAAALAEGDGKSASEAMNLAVDCLLRAGKANDALTQALALQKALPGDAGAPLQAAVSLAVGRAALAAGDPVQAGAAGAKAREQLGEAPDGVAAAAWIEGWAAYQLGRADEVTAAADRATGARQQVLRGLAALSRGERATAAGTLPSAGLDPADGALAWTEAALAAPSDALVWLDRAVAAADASQDPVARVRTRLAREAAARRGGASKAAGESRAQLLALAPAGAAGDPLRAEVAARAMLEGGKVSFPAGGALPGAIGAWSALSAGAAPPASDDPVSAGVGLWAEGRAAAATGATAQIFPAYSEALGKLPLHRQGNLNLGTALDGSDGVPVDADLALLVAMGETAPIDAHFALHEVGHRLDRYRRDVSGGVDLVAALPKEKGEGLRAAVARARAEIAAWQAGTGEYPKEALAALATVEAGLAKENGFGALLPTPMVAPTTQLEKLGGVGILSYRVTGGQLHGVVLSKRGSAARSLGPASKVFQAANMLRSNLEQAGKAGGTTLPAAGDRVRSILIDPFSDMLAGIGRYLVLVPDGLNIFPFTVLPEQSSGLRWLADIRTMAVLPSLATLSTPTHKIETYNPDFLGIGTGSSALNAPAAPPPTPDPDAEGGVEVQLELAAPAGLALDELGVSSRIFPAGLKVTASGDQAVKKVWTERASSSRYIHLNGLAASADGGIALTDGDLSLAEIRATPLGAQLVVITAPAPIEVQILRVQAFLDAGAKNVLVSAWPIPDQLRIRFLGAFYEAVGRDRTAARALTEAHEAIVRDDMAGDSVADPSSWGSFMLFGTP